MRNLFLKVFSIRSYAFNMYLFQFVVKFKIIFSRFPLLVDYGAELRGSDPEIFPVHI